MRKECDIILRPFGLERLFEKLWDRKGQVKLWIARLETSYGFIVRLPGGPFFIFYILYLVFCLPTNHNNLWTTCMEWIGQTTSARVIVPCICLTLTSYTSWRPPLGVSIIPDLRSTAIFSFFPLGTPLHDQLSVS